MSLHIVEALATAGEEPGADRGMVALLMGLGARGGLPRRALGGLIVAGVRPDALLSAQDRAGLLLRVPAQAVLGTGLAALDLAAGKAQGLRADPWLVAERGADALRAVGPERLDLGGRFDDPDMAPLSRAAGLLLCDEPALRRLRLRSRARLVAVERVGGEPLEGDRTLALALERAREAAGLGLADPPAVALVGDTDEELARELLHLADESPVLRVGLGLHALAILAHPTDGPRHRLCAEADAQGQVTVAVLDMASDVSARD